MRTKTLEAEVLGSTPWHEPSQSPPFAPQKSPGRLQCWVASGQTTNREETQPHPSADKQIKVEPRKMVQMNRFAGQKLRHRCREQTYGHQGGKAAGGGSVMNWAIEIEMYTLVYKIDD